MGTQKWRVRGLRAQVSLQSAGYYEGFDGVRTAIDREKQLKGWRRSKKIALLESANPRWADLAEKWGWKMAFAGESIKS